jgi:putative ABC transport system permease protein
MSSDLISKPRFVPLDLLRGNLFVRPVRSGLAITAIAVQVVLVLMIVGLTSGVVSDWGKRVEGVGADILVQPPNSSIFFALSSAVMQESVGDGIAALPGVDEIAPTLILMDQKYFAVVYGIDYRRFNALSQGFVYLEGRPVEAADEALADDIVAQARHLRVGDTISLLNHPFRVAGIVVHGKGARFFIPLKSAQDIAGAEKRVSMFYVRSKGDTEGTRAQIAKILPQSKIRSTAEYVSMMNSSNLPELKPFIRTMVGLGLVISFLVVLLTMHTMVLERTREIGILKALGYAKLDIVRLLLGEMLILALVGSGLGVGITYLTEAILKHTSPSLMILIPTVWVLYSILLALAGAAAGAVVPAARAAGFDPVVALACE